MAKYSIIPKNGGTPRYTGYLTYNGPYMKPAYVEFREISSPTPIPFEVGDYVVYDRIGLTFKLYYVPTPKKQARSNSYGAAYVYGNVQLFAATKDLEKTPFQDMSIENNNRIHFSSRNSASTFENVAGIAARIQACMDEFHPGEWDIRVVNPNGDVDITEPKEFTIDGSCLDALSRIYETWENIGWIHTVETRNNQLVNVITIGGPNVRSNDNTSDPFLYGKGNGLRTIKLDITNRDDIVTRLYPFGSERNLPNRYYNGKTIKDADSVDIKHLMLPISTWGTTVESGTALPDPVKAYVDPTDSTRIQKYGVIPKRVWFDGSDDREEIYPTIERVTIAEVRSGKSALGETDYVPSSTIYTDGTARVDEIAWAEELTDSGVIADDGKSYVSQGTQTISQHNESLSANTSNEIALATQQLSITSDDGVLIRGESDMVLTITSPFALDEGMTVTALLWNTGPGGAYTEKNVNYVVDSTGKSCTFSLPQMELPFVRESGIASISVAYSVVIEGTTHAAVLQIPASSIRFYSVFNVQSTFQLRIKQIGFDLNDRAAQGGGMTISMKDGMCGGRSFPINRCVYESATDSWLLTLTRQEDASTDVLYPNGDGYNISAGDHFVLLDIAMPEIYIAIAERRLWNAAQALVDELSTETVKYEPEIDAIVMAQESRSIREGMYMEITDGDVIGGTDYVLIDSLTISEGEAIIPTYKVVLRDKKRVSLSQTINRIRSIGSANSSSIQDNTQEIKKLAKSKQSESPSGGTTAFPLVFSTGSMSGFSGGLYNGSSQESLVVPSTVDHLTNGQTVPRLGEVVEEAGQDYPAIVKLTDASGNDIDIYLSGPEAVEGLIDELNGKAALNGNTTKDFKAKSIIFNFNGVTNVAKSLILDNTNNKLQFKISTTPATIQTLAFISDLADYVTLATAQNNISGAKTFLASLTASAGISTGGSITPSTDNSFNLGSGGSRFANANVTTLYTNTIGLRDNSTGDINQGRIYSNMYSSGYSEVGIVVSKLEQGASQSTDYGTLILDATNQAIYARGNTGAGYPQQFMLGHWNVPWSRVYADRVYLDANTYLEKETVSGVDYWHLKTSVSGGSVNLIVDGDIACAG